MIIQGFDNVPDFDMKVVRTMIRMSKRYVFRTDNKAYVKGDILYWQI